jgi:hypothetical protein
MLSGEGALVWPQLGKGCTRTVPTSLVGRSNLETLVGPRSAGCVQERVRQTAELPD